VGSFTTAATPSGQLSWMYAFWPSVATIVVPLAARVHSVANAIANTANVNCRVWRSMFVLLERLCLAHDGSLGFWKIVRWKHAQGTLVPERGDFYFSLDAVSQDVSCAAEQALYAAGFHF